MIVSEGCLGELPSRTALGVLRYGRDPVVAVLDSTRAGRNARERLRPPWDIPVVFILAESFALGPTAVLIGMARWRA